MRFIIEATKAVETNLIAQNRGREVEWRKDLIKEGVLEEAWVGLKRPKRRSAEGVSAAVAACSSPKSGTKFKSKSVAGRKVSRSPDLEVLDDVPVAPGSSVVSRGRHRVCLPRRQGSSLLRRVSAGGRGVPLKPAVARAGRMVARPKGVHAQLHTRAQARSPVERGVEQDLKDAEERPLAGAFKMAAPRVFSQSMSALGENREGKPVMDLAPGSQVSKEIVIISDEEEDLQEGTGCGAVPDSRGRVQAIYRLSGRMVGDQSVPVKVRAPSEHRPEGRVRSGAVHPTSGETTGADNAQPSTSQGAGAGWAYLDEELLDYEEEVEESLSHQKSGWWWQEKCLVWSRAAMSQLIARCPLATYLEVGRALLGL
ncbi:hypothetical protein NDU88_008875 [Pleurodeles waltl]|uniref:Uncharacterized protein n=1 Tax=Pleurodeles waltl TaxID=8319 RepID=A0AAV7PTF2_PLEWA|nr:hypothetical protein NDU88_008875 [Pleurodeles waltl]